MRPVLLDLFCGPGGASAGYAQAGFDVIGIDINPQPRYPYPFIQRDVMDFDLGLLVEETEATVIHASPPCQAYSLAQQIQQRLHPDLIAPARELLQDMGLPYVIENVVGAPLVDPVLLCGAMFGLRTYRHRLFESNIALSIPPHPVHVARTAVMGRPVADGEFMHVVGHFSNVTLAREIMGTPWMVRDEMADAIPPAYTTFIGGQLFAALRRGEVAA